MNLLQDFPSLHPLIIHFPIVLILIAVPFQAFLVWKNYIQIRWATVCIMSAAFLSALLASTVFHAEPSDDAPKEALMMFAQHEKFAFYTLWMSGITLVLKLIGDLYKIFRRSYDILVLATAIISATFLSIAGHHGAKLTHVAGVGPMGRYLSKEHEEHGGMKGMDQMGEMKNGDLKTNDSMPAMKDMPSKDSSENMSNMNMNNPKNDAKSMENMKGKNTMKNMKGMDKNSTDNKNMEGMKDMPGMNSGGKEKKENEKKDMKGMDDMKDMPGMNMNNDTKKETKNGMSGMQGMDNMNGMKKDPRDTMRFEDNNPNRKKLKSKK